MEHPAQRISLTLVVVGFQGWLMDWPRRGGNLPSILDESVRIEPGDQGSPMAPVDMDGHGEIVEDLPGVAHVRLEEEGFSVPGPALFGLDIEEEPLVPTLDEVH